MARCGCDRARKPSGIFFSSMFGTVASGRMGGCATDCALLRAVGGAGAAILTKELLKKYIEAEFAIFLICLKLICTLKMVQSHGTPSVQAVHDGATAANKKKYQALAIQRDPGPPP